MQNLLLNPLLRGRCHVPCDRAFTALFPGGWPWLRRTAPCSEDLRRSLGDEATLGMWMEPVKGANFCKGAGVLTLMFEQVLAARRNFPLLLHRLPKTLLG